MGYGRKTLAPTVKRAVEDWGDLAECIGLRRASGSNAPQLPHREPPPPFRAPLPDPTMTPPPCGPRLRVCPSAPSAGPTRSPAGTPGAACSPPGSAPGGLDRRGAGLSSGKRGPARPAFSAPSTLHGEDGAPTLGRRTISTQSPQNMRARSSFLEAGTAVELASVGPLGLENHRGPALLNHGNELAHAAARASSSLRDRAGGLGAREPVDDGLPPGRGR